MVRTDRRASLGPFQKSRLLEICRCCVADGVPRRSFYVAAIVGTILNVINQGDALLGEGRVQWIKLALTFVVPYGVATYGAVSYRLRQAAAFDADGADRRKNGL